MIGSLTARVADFVEQMGQDNKAAEAAAPDHDPALLFRSLEKKFMAADPTEILSGGCVTTHISQNKMR